MNQDTNSLHYLKERVGLINSEKALDHKYGVPKQSDTVYLTAADENGMMISYIQSNYFSFGSGIVIPKTGISLQNRGSGFTLEEGHPNQVGPNKRPFHTIIPAFVTRNNKPLMSFGVMGGPYQPQGHVNVICRIFDYKQNPQAASDAPRWQAEDHRLHVRPDPLRDQRYNPGRRYRVPLADPAARQAGQMSRYLEDGSGRRPSAEIFPRSSP